MKILFCLLLGISMSLFLTGCLNAKAKLDTDIQTQIRAEIAPKLDAVVAGQAGVNNKLETISNDVHQELRAGRDVNNSTVQFNQQMLDALRSANEVAIQSIKSFAYVLVSLFGAVSTCLSIVFHRGKKKAEAVAEMATKELKTKQMHFERALAALPPDMAAKVFPKE